MNNLIGNFPIKMTILDKPGADLHDINLYIEIVPYLDMHSKRWGITEHVWIEQKEAEAHLKVLKVRTQFKTGLEWQNTLAI